MSWLIAHCRPHSVAGSEPATLVADPCRGTVGDLGFADDGLSIAHRPPRPEKPPCESMCFDRFFRVERADGGRAIGRAEVREAFVYDWYMRSEIDFTGLELVLSLDARAFEAYRDYVGPVVRTYRMADDRGRRPWDGSVVLRIPTRRFAFPMPRGSSDPWSPRTPGVGTLRSVARFDLDALEVLKLQDESGCGVGFDDAVAGRCGPLRPPLRLAAR